MRKKCVCNVYVFQMSFHFAYHRWWLGMEKDALCGMRRRQREMLTFIFSPPHLPTQIFLIRMQNFHFPAGGIFWWCFSFNPNLNIHSFFPYPASVYVSLSCLRSTLQGKKARCITCGMRRRQGETHFHFSSESESLLVSFSSHT